MQDCRFLVGTIFNILGAANRYRGLVRSQYWSEEQLRSYRTTALDETLLAAVRIPYYAARFGGSPQADDLPRLPTIGRLEIAELNRSVLGLYPGGSRFSSDSSSGSTGTPAEFIFDDPHQRGRFAARARYLRENGWTPFKRTVWLTYGVFRMARNDDVRLMRSRLRMSNHFISASPSLGVNLEQVCGLDPVFLYTFPSYLEILLNRLAETGRRLPSLRKIFVGAEVLEDSLRQRTKEELGVDIAENYGSTEAFLAWECPAGNRHINAEHVLLEIVDAHGHPVATGQIGKVLVTTLQSRLAPLVRYEIGDYAVAASGSCDCGRTLPLIGKVVGRGMNLFRLRDGQLISPWHLATAVRNRTEVRQFQIVQNSVERFTIRFVSHCPLTAEAEEVIRGGFRKVLDNNVSVDFQRVTEVARTAGGKYMTALSELTNH
jgi:phenylacetate-CoA ligase